MNHPTEPRRRHRVILTAALAFTAIACAPAASSEVADLGADAQMACFVKNREALADDPYRPLYHVSPPGFGLHDPAGLCWWQGKYPLIDRSIIEVFANGRQCLTLRADPTRPDSTRVSVFARGSEASLVSFTAYQMKSIWPERKDKEGR